jgi:hypothetical protein
MNSRNSILLYILIFSSTCFAGPGGGPPNPGGAPPPPGVPIEYNILTIFIIVLISIFIFKKTTHKLLK